ncbi:MAG: hypothetical protein ACPGNT_10635 [Rhodospirillales bacterium]
MDPVSLVLVLVLFLALVLVLRVHGRSVRLPLGPLQGLACRLGLHDWQVTDIRMGFGPAGDVETLECRHCHLRASQHHQRHQDEDDDNRN